MTKKKQILINSKAIGELQKTIESVKKELSNCPVGRLKVHRSKNRTAPFFTVETGSSSERTEKYISIKDKALPRYAQKRYYSNLLKVLEKDLVSLNAGRVISYQPRVKVYENLPEELKEFVVPIFKPMSLICKEWADKDYERSNYPIQPNSSYKTQKGELVRSKNECIVADRLYNAGIPYRYEASVRLQNGSIVHPDFTVKNPRTGQLSFIEIVGMMDDQNYIERNMQKLHDYPFEPWYRDLYFLFAHKDIPFDPAAIDALIEHYFR